MMVNKLSTEEVRRRFKLIQEDHFLAIKKADQKRESALKELQNQCPHKNSESGEGGSLDYWYECKDCGKR